MVKGSSVVPATPMKTSGARDDEPSSTPETPRMAVIAKRSVSFEDDSAADLDTNMEEYDDLEEKAHAPAVVTPETPEGAIVTTTRSGGTRSLSRNLAKELDDVARPDPAYSDDGMMIMEKRNPPRRLRGARRNLRATTRRSTGTPQRPTRSSVGA
ncbi:hypothetical protein PF011_g27446 [Phytophthora fragariae]|uniref:Uncharacterized protein n=1 Tax=Phytophthora fragariae TaxID=53985 RepID=A0A6A3HGR0_9STRA|nr:hypothetical protein PF011_g27446 [Phytophthora fragariae]